MQYRLLTIAREYGSGGAEIASIVAQALGWRLLDNSLLSEISRAARVPISDVVALDETIDPWLARIMRPLWGTSPDGMSPVGPVHLFDADAEAEFADKVIRNAYDPGRCVIVGRGAQCVLRREADVFHVFVYANWEERIERARGRHSGGTDLEALLVEMDERRLQYVERHYDADWFDPHLYDLMVNCNNQPQLAAELILAAMQAGQPYISQGATPTTFAEALMAES